MTDVKELDYAYLSQWFYVDSSSISGLRWKQNCPMVCEKHKNFRFKDDIAGNKSLHHWRVSLQGTNYIVSRIVYCLTYGSILSEMVIDHKDGNRYNNQIDNLRLVTHKGNNRNRKKNVNNSTGHTGISRVHVPNRSGGFNNYYRVTLIFQNKKVIKSFNIGKLGDTVALNEAIKFKTSYIENLYQDGYTERHGNEQFI